MVVGQIKEIYCTDSCLTDGEPDVSKIKPFLQNVKMATPSQILDYITHYGEDDTRNR